MIRTQMAALATAVLALGACSPADTRFSSPPAEPSVKVASRYASLEVVEVTLPSYAASEEISVQSADGSIMAMGSLWADDPARAMTLQLARDLGAITGRTVAPEPWPFREPGDARIDIRFEEMVAVEGAEFRIAGQYFVAPVAVDGRGHSGRFAISVPLTEDASPALIAAARGEAVTRLAEQIAREGLR